MSETSKKVTGISRAEYASRRSRLMAELPEGSLVIVSSSSEQLRSRDTFFPFRQDSDFLYLTGFQEPESLLVLVPGRAQGETLLFCRECDAEKERWDGPRLGPERAARQCSLSDGFPIGDLDDILPGLMEGRDRVYFPMGRYPHLDRRIRSYQQRIAAAPDGKGAPEMVDLDYQLRELRLIKSSQEIRLMGKAAEISAEAHLRAMTRCQPGLCEFQLEAALLHTFVNSGARETAYPTIVGGGSNALIMHYCSNNAALADGDMVLVDAGCEYRGYVADITRSYPVNGRFNGAQRALYEIVLAAQQAAIDQVVEGNHWDQPHAASVEEITRGLVDLGLLRGEIQGLIESGAYQRFYMHRVGHWLGMDVHDVGDYRVHGAWRQLEAGMVMTIEPGIYVPINDENIPAEFRGIGIRIEDDIALTNRGAQILSAAAPKTIEDIEYTMLHGRDLLTR
ncbi:aminopeptidase P N-terminal domain-containing protein [Microbulbifer sp. OS29]|uniref:Xaa-Pro aminopeptidase n=1 Tax=Microbulbifer okhotskensis TaxID=2926617 RepID=A0A9X2J3C4_9GAMM|nr:aminopeptidase P N-terminal domain-containing protein [Microbulbifer okhotskensis]MCO1333402.1 aminopeptidase P N-terminal domain-containing protein [Microbulbifer okhotskensis]